MHFAELAQKIIRWADHLGIEGDLLVPFVHSFTKDHC
jgi:hypothetical protein